MIFQNPLLPNHDSVRISILNNRNLKKAINYDINQIVIYYLVAPKIDRKNLGKKEVRQGKFLKFEADIEGEPAPTVTWSLNEQTILFNDR